MPNPREEIGRKDALKIIGGALLGVALASCGVKNAIDSQSKEEPSPLASPTSSRRDAAPTITAVIATPLPTSKPVVNEATSTPQPEVFYAYPITRAFLLNGFSGHKDLDQVTLVSGDGQQQKKRDTLSGLFDYSTRNWDSAAIESDLKSDPVIVLKVLLSSIQNSGTERTTAYSWRISPGFEDMRFFRFPAENLGGLEKVLPGALPKDVKIRKGTNLTVLGGYTDEKGEKRIIASFDEGFDRSKDGITARDIPRQFLADVSQATLEQVFDQNNISFKDGKIRFKTSQGRECVWLLNPFDKETVELIKKETGVLWVDQKADGKWYKNPVVKSPPEKIIGKSQAEVIKTAEGKIVAQDANKKQTAEAKYDEVKNEWVWESLPEVSQEEVMDIEGLKKVWSSEKKVWEYRDSKDNTIVGAWNQKDKKFEVDPYATLKAEYKGLFVPTTAQEAGDIFEKSLAKNDYIFAIPLNFTQGEIKVIKGFGPLLAFKGLPVGTIFRSPFDAKISRAASTDLARIDLLNIDRNINLAAYFFKNFDNVMAGNGNIKAGEAVFKTTDNYIPSRVMVTPNTGDYQFDLGLQDIGRSKPIDTSFNNLARDSKGRFLYIK